MARMASSPPGRGAASRGSAGARARALATRLLLPASYTGLPLPALPLPQKRLHYFLYFRILGDFI
eukprot:scaffold19730_cov121-Isochrysis_galbana.AAC.2